MEASFVVVSVVVGSGTVAYVIYIGVGTGTIAPGVLGRNIVLATSIWRTGHWFLVAVDWGHIVCVLVMDG